MSYRTVIGRRSFLGIVISMILALVYVKRFDATGSFEFGVIITMYTFFYGFFISSIFKFLERKYSTFKKLMGATMAEIQNLNHLAVMVGRKKLVNQIADKSIILLKKLDKLSPEEYEKAQDATNDLYKVMYKFKPTKKESGYTEDLYLRMISQLNALCKSREKMELLGDNYLVGQTKWIFLVSTLAFTTFILTAALFSASIVNAVVGLILILIVVFVVNLMFDLDDLSYGKHKIQRSNINATIKEIKKNSKKFR